MKVLRVIFIGCVAVVLGLLHVVLLPLATKVLLSGRVETICPYALPFPACPAAWLMAASSVSVAPRFSTSVTAPAASARPRVCASA